MPVWISAHSRSRLVPVTWAQVRRQMRKDEVGA